MDDIRITVFHVIGDELVPRERIGKYAAKEARIRFRQGEGIAGEVWKRGVGSPCWGTRALPGAKGDESVKMKMLPRGNRKKWGAETCLTRDQIELLGEELPCHMVFEPVKMGEEVLAVLSMDLFNPYPGTKTQSCSTQLSKLADSLVGVICASQTGEDHGNR